MVATKREQKFTDALESGCVPHLFDPLMRRMTEAKRCRRDLRELTKLTMQYDLPAGGIEAIKTRLLAAQCEAIAMIREIADSPV